MALVVYLFFGNFFLLNSTICEHEVWGKVGPPPPLCPVPLGV